MAVKILEIRRRTAESHLHLGWFEGLVMSENQNFDILEEGVINAVRLSFQKYDYSQWGFEYMPMKGWVTS